MSTYFFAILLLSLGKGQGPLFITRIPFTKKCFVSNINWSWPISSEEDFWILSMYSSYFVIISPCKMVWSFVEQIWIPFTKRWSVPCFVEIGTGSVEEFSSMYFRYFITISPWKRTLAPTFEKTWIPLTKVLFWSMFGWYWHCGSHRFPEKNNSNQ